MLPVLQYMRTAATGAVRSARRMTVIHMQDADALIRRVDEAVGLLGLGWLRSRCGSRGVLRGLYGTHAVGHEGDAEKSETKTGRPAARHPSPTF